MGVGAWLERATVAPRRRLSVWAAMDRRGIATERIVVAKGYCTPSRHALTAILRPYAVWFDAPMFDSAGPPDPALGVAQYQTAEIFVKCAQAPWAEYLILSAKTPAGGSIFQVLSTPKDRRNARWARRRRGLPMPWALEAGTLRHAWIDSDCTDPALDGVRRTDRRGRVAAVRGYGGVEYTKEGRRSGRRRG